MANWDGVRTKLQARRAELKERLYNLEEALDAPASRDDEDRAIEREDDEVKERLGQVGLAEIDMIDAAMQRIDAGTYGICQQCAAEILEQRLELLPYTPLCRSCAP